MGHVEDVVDDLEGEAGFFAEGAEAGDGGSSGFLVLFEGCLQRVELSLSGEGSFAASASSASAKTHGTAHLADTEEASGDDAGGDEGSGLGAVDGFDQFCCWGLALGFDVDYLAADHAGGQGGVWTYSCAYCEGDFAEDGYGGRGWGWECGDGLEGEGLEGVAGEDGDGFAEDLVAGGLAAAEVVVVEGGQVVVDEGVGVEHFYGCAEVGCAFGNFSGSGDHSGGFHAEDGAEAFAACEGTVTHGAVDGVREGVGRGQESFESGVGELRARVQQGFYVGIHQG